MGQVAVEGLSRAALATLGVETFALAATVGFLTWRQQAHYWLRLRYSVVVYLFALAAALGARTDQGPFALLARLGAVAAGLLVFVSLLLSWRALFTKPVSGELERRNFELSLAAYRAAAELSREADLKLRELRGVPGPSPPGSDF